jgi:hypothetical protein
MFKSTRAIQIVILLCVGLAFSSPAEAYIGPGVGVGAILTTLGILASFFMLLVGFIWYPIKRLLRKIFRSDKPDQ